MSVVKVRAALETALNAMPGMMAITSSSIAAATVITTTLPHGLTTGMVVVITGHTGSTPAISGAYIVTVTGAATFTIPVAVTVDGTGGAWTATASDNVSFAPPASSVPYQDVTVLFAPPENIEFGSNHREVGYMQVKLMYPLQAGTAAVSARAELLRTTFYRGASFTNGGVTVVIDQTPEVSPGSVEGDRYAIPVKVRFYANIL